MKRRVTSLFVLMVVFVLTLSQSSVYAGSVNDEKVEYGITEDTVIIDYKEYPISNNSIQYRGKVYKIVDSVLISTDNDGNETILVLPIEDNRVTDPEEISRLNRTLIINEVFNKHVAGAARYFPSAISGNVVSLPYKSKVQYGDDIIMTPQFDIITSGYFLKTNVKLTKLPPKDERIFSVGFLYALPDGRWYHHSTKNNYNFGKKSVASFENVSAMRYGMFSLTNLYGKSGYEYMIYGTRL